MDPSRRHVDDEEPLTLGQTMDEEQSRAPPTPESAGHAARDRYIVVSRQDSSGAERTGVWMRPMGTLCRL